MKQPIMTTNLTCFLRTIAYSEGTLHCPITKCEGYDVIVTGADGKPEIFYNFKTHPFENRPPKKISDHLYSTASGRYQLLYRYYEIYKEELGLNDFSPISQDKIAIQQIKERNALEDIYSGRIYMAINKCGTIWASLPGSGYGQPQNSLEALIAMYKSSGGAVV
jgi:muramidase (phage lysozyme)